MMLIVFLGQDVAELVHLVVAEAAAPLQQLAVPVLRSQLDLVLFAQIIRLGINLTLLAQLQDHVIHTLTVLSALVMRSMIMNVL